MDTVNLDKIRGLLVELNSKNLTAKKNELVDFESLINEIDLIKVEKKIPAIKDDLSEMDYEAFFYNSLDAIFIYNLDAVTHVNNAFLNLFGHDSIDEIIGLDPIKTFYASKGHGIVKTATIRLKKNENTVFIPKIINVKKDGSTFFAESNISKVIINGNMHVQISVREITERISALIELEESKERYKKLFEYLPDALYLNSNGIISDVNIQFLKLFKYNSKAEIVGKSELGTLIFKDDQINIRNIIKESGKESVVLIPELRRIKSDGTVFMSESYASITEVDGASVVQIMCRDITKRIELENKLRESEEEFKGLFGSLGDLFTRVNNKGIFEVVSPSVFELLGYKPEDLIGETTDQFYIDLSDRERFLEELRDNGSCMNYEIPIVDKSGNVRILSVNSKVYFNENGESAGVESLSRDITDYKQQENKVVQNESLLSSINKNSPDLIITIDKGFDVIYSNRAIDGVEVEDIIGKNILEFVPEIIQNEYFENLEKCFNGEKANLEIQEIRDNGVLYWSAIRMAPVIENKKVLSLLIVSTDITERKKVEKEKEIINTISQKINSKISLISFCEFVFSKIEEIKPFKDIYTSLYNENKNEVKILLQYVNGKIINTSIPSKKVGNGLSEYIIKNKIGLVLNGEELTDFQIDNNIKVYGKPAKSWIGVPLVSDDKVIGVLAAQNFDDSSYFTNYDLNLLTFIGTQLGSIIEREKAEKELITEKERVTLATASSKMGVYDWDIKSDTLIWDDVMYEVFGVKKSNFSSDFKAWSSSLHPDDVERSGSEVDMAIKGIKDFNSGFRIILPDKSVRYIHGLGKVLRDENNEPYRMIGMNWDISEQKLIEGRAKGIADILEAFITEENSTESFNKMLKVLLEVTGSEYGFVAEVIHDKKKNKESYLKTLSQTDISWNKNTKTYYDGDLEDDLKFKDLKTLFGNVLVSGEAIISNSPNAGSIIEGLPNSNKSADSFMGIPIFNHKDFIGMVGMANKSSTYSPKDIEQIKPFLSVCSTLLKGYQDAIKKDIAKKRLRELADIVSYSSDAIISSNNNGEIVSWNNGAVNLLGYSKEEILGTSIDDLLFKNNKFSFKEEVNTNIESYETFQFNKPGKKIPVNMSIFPLIDENGDVKGMSSILRDISEQKEIQKLKDKFTTNLEESVKIRTIELESAKKELAISLNKEKKLNSLKSKFVSTVSHQFRTPLAVIQGCIGVLEIQKEGMTPKLLTSFEKMNFRMKRQIKHMAELMNDILVLSEINLGKHKVFRESINIENLINDVLKNHNEIQMDNRTSLLIVKGVSRHIVLDFKLMEHALSNLISNAFKFSKNEDSPTVILNYRSKDVLITIKDNGIGIPIEGLKYLFEPFYRASNVNEIEGTGIGTSIAKEYIELNSGTINVSSVLNKGTEFNIKLFY
jgi:PAS domain S-box-containing protein